jgi:prepilin-type processing-associated H-X9-DG protein
MANLTQARRTSGKAVISLVLGLLCVPGPVALALGFLGLRDINRSDGQLRGRPLAVAGMVLGLFGTLLSVLGTLAVIVLTLQARSDRETCRHRLGQIGQAVFQYHERHQEYPAGTVPLQGVPPERRFSWLAELLPFPALKQNALYQRLDLARPWDDEANRPAVRTPLREFLCPSDRSDPVPDAPGLTEYVGIAGLGPGAAALPRGDRRAGMFGYDRRITADDVTRGTSTTMLATETTRDVGPWAAGGPATVRAVDPAERPYIGPGRPFGGLHRGGLNVLFADGAVQFVPDGIKPEIFEAQATIAADEF